MADSTQGHHHHHHHHHHDSIHDFRKNGIHRIQRRKTFVNVAYWSLFLMAVLSVIAVFMVYAFL